MKIKHSNKKLNSKKEEKTIKDFKKELNYDKDIEEDCFERNNKVKDNRYDYLEDELALNLDNNKKILSQNIIKTTNFCPKRNLVDSNNNKNKNNPQKKKSTYKKDDKELKLKVSNISDNLLITDLDEFFRNIYEYYYNKGFNNILTQTILDNISYLFSIHFMVINIFIIDWREIIFECKTNNACSSEITQYFTKDKIMNNLIKYRIYFSIFYTSFIIYYLIFLIKSIILLRNMKFIKKIYDTKLKIKQSEMEDLRFDTVLTKLISLQRTEGFCRIKENITKFDIVSRIMRQENYLIALFSNGLIDTKINFCFNLKLPFCKTEIYKKKFGIDLFSNFFYTKLNESVINFAFGTNDKSLNKDFINLKSLRLKLFIFMIFEIIFLFPFVFLKFIFWIFKNADNLKSDKKTIFSQKNWNKKIQIFFKNYNELQHYFDYRMINSNHYLNCFNNCFKYKEKLFNIFKKFLKLIFGSILILIFFLSFSDSRLLTDLNIFGKNFVWIGIMVGIILSLTEEKNIQETKENPYLMISEDDSLSNDNHSPENKFDGDNRQFYYKKLLNCLINIPKEWPKNFEYFSKINKKINNYHELTIITIIKEIFATVFFPIIWIKLIIQAEKIRQFILQNSVEIQGIGTICSFSYFNFYNFKKQREKKDTFIEFNFNDKKFFNSSFYFRVSE